MSHFGNTPNLRTEYTLLYNHQTMAVPGHRRTQADEILSKNAGISHFIQLLWISPDVPG
jgi:hypothetical protein